MLRVWRKTDSSLERIVFWALMAGVMYGFCGLAGHDTDFRGACLSRRFVRVESKRVKYSGNDVGIVVCKSEASISMQNAGMSIDLKHLVILVIRGDRV